MKKLNIISILILFLFITGNVLSQNANWCGTDLLLEQKFQKDPSLKQKFEKNLQLIHNNAQNYKNNKSLAGVLQIVPVVIHVIHDNCLGNISDAQIQDGIRVLNEDFRRLNADTSSTRDLFKPFATDCEFEFRLAQIDDNSLCTNGIVRINSPLTYHDMNDETALKSLSYWNSSKYFNIWLVNDINSGTVGGYAQFPGWGSWSTYGVVMRHDAFGTIGTSFADGRTTTHEVGHCFGLSHTFQGGCGTNCSSSGDYICDTPPVANSTFGCNNTENTCSNDASGPSPFISDVVDQFENYMSYNACQNMFTQNQKSAMKSAINSYATLTNLVSPTNLTATGTNGNNILCAADFTTDNSTLCSGNVTICSGNVINFFDASYHGQTTWNWSFPGGTPSTSTDINPVITYNTPGVFDVSLSVSNGADSVSTTKIAYINVMMPQTVPFSESFESVAIPGSEWEIINNDNGNTWELTTATSYSGNVSLKMNNFSGNTIGETDEAINSIIDLSVMDTAQFTFKVAYAQKNSSTNDVLWIYVSNDCGDSWITFTVITGVNLSSVGYQTSEFIPVDTSEWREISINIPSAYLAANFRFKFKFICNLGNNLYIDDINIDGVYNALILVSPPNYSTGQPDYVTLDWNAVAGVDYYQYEIDTSLLFSSPLLVGGTKAYISSSNNNSDTEYEILNLEMGTTYYWRVSTITGIDTSDWSSVWRFTTLAPIGIDDDITSNVNLLVFPNPVENYSVISFNLPRTCGVTLKVYDILGREILNLIDEKLNAGTYRYETKGVENSGIYFVRLVVGNQQITMKIIIK